MNYLILVFCLIFTSHLETPKENSSYELRVEITRIKEQKGTIRVCLIDNEADFLSSCMMSRNVVANATTTVVSFKDLPPGTYCISLYHDVDDNDNLNLEGAFGMPSEPYGFSNNPSTFFGPPKFKKCSFELTESKQITIRLK